MTFSAFLSWVVGWSIIGGVATIGLSNKHPFFTVEFGEKLFFVAFVLSGYLVVDSIWTLVSWLFECTEG